jgi:micrococcal nuclease
MQLKTILFAITAALVAVLSSSILSAFASTFSAKVVSVIDGNTVSVAQNGTKERVILYGIDCPELGQQFGQEAKQFTDDKCFGKVVTLDDRGKDAHGRTIAVIQLPDGTNLNQELVRQGLAWWSDKFAPNDQEIKQLFVAAKNSHKGLWSEPNPIAPWTFRNGERKTQAEIKYK